VTRIAAAIMILEMKEIEDGGRSEDDIIGGIDQNKITGKRVPAMKVERRGNVEAVIVVNERGKKEYDLDHLQKFKKKKKKIGAILTVTNALCCFLLREFQIYFSLHVHFIQILGFLVSINDLEYY